MKIMIFTIFRETDTGYSEFIHSRNIAYLQKGNSVSVFTPSVKTKNKNVNGVNVYTGNTTDMNKLLLEYKPDIVFFHFFLRFRKKYNQIIIKQNIPVLIFIHGFEIIRWWRYYFSFSAKSLYSIIFRIQSNIRQLLYFRNVNIIANKRNNFGYIFVSNWMKTIAEKDLRSRIQAYRIVPNSIDLNNYKYSIKKEDDRLNIISIRSLSNKKYATDILYKIISKLSKKDFFSKLNIHLNFYSHKTKYGKKLLKKFYQLSSKFINIKVSNKFLTQQEMNYLYSQNGIFLGPTRMDSQGVTICEASACGLVPIVSNNTAIPEFIDDSFGFLCNLVDDFVYSIKYLYNNPDKFIKMSKEATKNMKSYDAINLTKQELNFAHDLIENSKDIVI